MSILDFIKKPVEIQAVQFVDNMSAKEIVDWFEASRYGKRHNIQIVSERSNAGDVFVKALIIHTLEGAMRADLNDWIIRGVKGEFYPCKPDVFEDSYAPKEEA